MIDEPVGPFRRNLPLIAAIIVAGAAAIAFGYRTLDAGFIMGDDQRFITEHYLVAHPSAENAWKLLTIPHGDLYQPLPMLSFQANVAMGSTGAGHVSPFAFHVTNVILHMINAVLVVVLAFSMTRRANLAAFVGVLFAVHPMAMETVGWVSGRMILLATTFALVVFILAVRRARTPELGWPVALWIAWAASLASKVLPTVPIAAWLLDRATHRHHSRRAGWTYAVLFGIGLVAVVAMSRLSASEGFTAAMPTRAGDALKTVLLAGGRYIDQYVVPTHLSPWTPPLEGVPWNDPRVFLATLKLAVLLVAAIALRRQAPLVSAGLGAFLLLLAPFLVASLARRLFVADRYMYLPMIGLHLALVISVAAVFGRRESSDASSARRANRLVALPFAALAGWWLWIGIGLAPVWKDTLTYATRIVDVFPDDPDAHNELARAQLFMDRPEDARQTAAAALARWPDEPRLSAQLGEALRMLGRHEAAVEAFDRMLAVHPGHTRTRYLRALSLIDLGRTAEALTALESLVEDVPSFLPAYRSLAMLYRDKGDVVKQRNALERAIALNAQHRDNLFDLAMLDYSQGRLSEAENGFRRLIRLNPNDEPALLNLGAILARQGRNVDAIKCYDRLLEKRPDELPARFNRGDLLLAMGQYAAAEEDFQAILESDPSNIDAAERIHEILQARRNWDALRRHWPQFAAATTRSDETDCYALWAEMLAAFELRNPLPAAITDGPPADDCAGWAGVYASLRRQDWDGLTAALTDCAHRANEDTVAAEAKRTPTADALDRRRRIWMAAFNDLPVDLRNSRPGLCVLARLLHDFGDDETAHKIASGLTAENDVWGRIANDILTVAKGDLQ